MLEPCGWLTENGNIFAMTTKLKRGQGLIEYIVGISIFLLLAAPVLYQIYVALAQKLSAISVQIAP